jgi:hypothetical protein
MVSKISELLRVGQKPKVEMIPKMYIDDRPIIRIHSPFDSCDRAAGRFGMPSLDE